MTHTSIPAFVLPGLYRAERQPETGYRAERRQFEQLAKTGRTRRWRWFG